MIRLRKYILYLLLATVPVMLVVASAMAQGGVIYSGDTTELSIEPIPGGTYYWEIFCDPSVNFATASGNCTGNEAEILGRNDLPAVKVKWNKPGTYFYKIFVSDADGCTNFKIGKAEVEEALPVAVLEVDPDSVCVGDWAELKVSFTGIAPWSFVLEADDGMNKTTTTFTDIGDNPYVIPVGPTVTTLYRIISLTDVNGTNHNPSGAVTLEVSPLPRSSRIYLKDN